MKKIVLKFGIISGVMLAAVSAVLMPLCLKAEGSVVVGYTAMVAAFLFVFFGIRSYREQLGGTITFGQAFKVGIFITLITCAFYVVAWEIVYFNFLPDFAETYGAHMIEKMRRNGESAAAILEAQQKMAEFARAYKNPLYNIGVTFMEIFPVGLIVTLVSAAILRRKTLAPAMA
jgi:hypothetical protein